MAVLPTPMMSTRSPIVSMWLNATDSSQAMPMWMRSLSCRPGSSSSLPFGAPVPTNTASNSSASSSSRMLLDGEFSAGPRPCRRCADFLVEHLRRQAEGRDVGAHQAAGRRRTARKS